MADRFKYSEVRQKIIDAIRTDLIGPREKEEVLEENPRYAYLVGMLDIQSDDEDYSGAGEQEVDADMAFEDGEDFTAGEDDDNEPISTTHFQLPSSSLTVSMLVFTAFAICSMDKPISFKAKAVSLACSNFPSLRPSSSPFSKYSKSLINKVIYSCLHSRFRLAFLTASSSFLT